MHRFALLSAALLAMLAPALAGEVMDLRDQRYCEILIGKGGLLMPKEFDVYNTIGLNDCPEDLWSKIDVETIKAETGARFVKLNGPRHWMIDGMTDTTLVSTEKRGFDGLEMRLAGILKLPLEDMLKPPKPYQQLTVERHTTWVYLAGQPVFQLIDDKGNVFFMQSYSLEKDANQTAQSLSQLGATLALPSGWSFRNLALKADYNLTALDNMATVTQDELLNTYQLAPGATADQF
ncbi:MAG: hypothetical protein JNJ53_03935 [Rhizobiales bacterium]|nr:hypothetical protein [Hyphomicrobiales bacterium]